MRGEQLQDEDQEPAPHDPVVDVAGGSGRGLLLRPRGGLGRPGAPHLDRRGGEQPPRGPHARSEGRHHRLPRHERPADVRPPGHGRLRHEPDGYAHDRHRTGSAADDHVDVPPSGRKRRSGVRPDDPGQRRLRWPHLPGDGWKPPVGPRPRPLERDDLRVPPSPGHLELRHHRHRLRHPHPRHGHGQLRHHDRPGRPGRPPADQRVLHRRARLRGDRQPDGSGTGPHRLDPRVLLARRPDRRLPAARLHPPRRRGARHHRAERHQLPRSAALPRVHRLERPLGSGRRVGDRPSRQHRHGRRLPRRQPGGDDHAQAGEPELDRGDQPAGRLAGWPVRGRRDAGLLRGHR